MSNTKTTSYLNIIPFSTLSNWSASFALGNNLNYNKDYPLVKIGSLIIRNRDKAVIKDEDTYKRVTIKLYGKGVVIRDEVKGKEIGTKNQFRVSEGQFIMSKIDARNGAFGLVPRDLQNAITTQDFLSYNINIELVDPDFFLLFITTKKFLELCQSASSGTTGRQRIDENLFLNFLVPLPDIRIQRELVRNSKKQIRESETQRATVGDLRNQIATLLSEKLGIGKTVQRSVRKQFVVARYKDIKSWGAEAILVISDTEGQPLSFTTLKEQPQLIKLCKRGKSPVYDDKGNDIILNQKCNRWNNIELEHAKRVSSKWYSKLDHDLFTRAGDIIINSTGEGTIGRASYVTSEYEGLMYDSHMLLLRLDTEKVNPRFIVYLINSEYGQNQINTLKSAKSTKQTELGVQNLLRIQLPMASKDTQDYIVEYINERENKFNHLLKLIEQQSYKIIEDFERTIFN